MQVEHINPFVRSLSNAFQTMLACPVRRGEIFLAKGDQAIYPVSGVIGLSGGAVGMVLLNLSEGVALKAASTLLMCEATEINDDVIDAVGELANVVAGAAKSELSEYNLSISLPTVITGLHHEVHFPSNVSPICVPFESEWGPLNLQFGLVPAPDRACATTSTV